MTVILTTGEGEAGSVMASMKTLGPVDSDNPTWTEEAPLLTGRKDHACAYFTMDDDPGINISYHVLLFTLYKIKESLLQVFS